MNKDTPKLTEILIDQATDKVIQPVDIEGMSGGFVRSIRGVYIDLGQPATYVIHYLRHHPDGTSGVYDSRDGDNRVGCFK